MTCRFAFLKPGAVLAVSALLTLLTACDDQRPPPGGTSGPANAASRPTAEGPASAASRPTADGTANAESRPAAPTSASSASADAGGASASSAVPPDASPTAPDPPAAAPDAGSSGAPTRDAGPPRDAGADASRGDAGAPPVPPATADAGAAAAPAPSVPPPEPGSADAVAAEVDAIYVGKKTFAARFKQEHTQKISGVVKKQSGAVAVEKPNKISFRYDPPSQNRIVSDGLSLKIYVAEDKQMFVTPVQNTEYPGALSFLMGRGLRPSFTFTFNDKATFEGGPVLVGKPRAPTPHYEFVMFYIDKQLLAKKDPGTVRRVLIVDVQGNRNRFDFEGASQPATIDPAEFQFAPPPGTDVKQN